jgi:DNA-binding XRE family transcriptional regulator
MTTTSFRKMFDDLPKCGVEAIGEDALAYIDSFLTPDEIRESNLRVALIGEIIKARQEKGLSQRQLGELSGVKEPIIARMEKGTTSPQLDTILKILAPLGKTLAIVPLER